MGFRAISYDGIRKAMNPMLVNDQDAGNARHAC
jgi:hypothetical protein